MVPVDRSSDSEMGTAETMKGTMRTLYWCTGYGCGKALRGHLYGLCSYLGKLRLGGVTSLSWEISWGGPGILIPKLVPHWRSSFLGSEGHCPISGFPS